MKDQAPTTREFIDSLLSPQREEELDSFWLINLMPIEPYDHVADIGSGPGYFTIPLAKYLVYGKVYALDTLDEMLDALRPRVAMANLGNVEILKCAESDFPVPKDSLDGIFLAFVIHENDSRVAFLKAAMDLLKPRGWCTVLEWYPKETEGWPPVEQRIAPGELEGLTRDAGFQFRWWREINSCHYMAELRKVN